MGDFRRHNASFGYRGYRGGSNFSAGHHDRSAQQQYSPRQGGSQGSFYHDDRSSDFDRGNSYRSQNSRSRGHNFNTYNSSSWPDQQPSNEFNELFRRHNDTNKQIRAGMDAESLSVIERIRSYTTYLVRRKREITDQHKLRELGEEVEEIDFCLEVVNDIKTDSSYGLQTMKSVLNRILELVRNNPISNAFPDNPDSDSENDEAEAAPPRSPSPAPDNEEQPSYSSMNLNPRMIPMERSLVKPDWGYKPPTNDYDGRVEPDTQTSWGDNRHSFNHYDASRSSGARTSSQEHQIWNSNRQPSRERLWGNRYDDAPPRDDIRQPFNSFERSPSSSIDSSEPAVSSSTDWIDKPFDRRSSHQSSNHDFQSSQPASADWSPLEASSAKDQDMRVLETDRNSIAAFPVSERPNVNSVGVGIASTSTLPKVNAGFGVDFMRNGVTQHQSPINSSFIAPALMNQMVLGLQLTPQQQQVLAMNMVQNQKGLFTPRYPLQTGNSCPPQINNVHLPRMPPPPPMRNMSTSLLGNPPPMLTPRPRPPLLPIPVGPPLRARFEIRNDVRNIRPTFTPRAQVHDNQSRASNNYPHQPSNLASQFREKAAQCFGNKPQISQQRHQPPSVNSQDSTPTRVSTTEKEADNIESVQESLVASNQIIASRDPRLKSRMAKIAPAAKVPEGQPDLNNDESNQSREDVDDVRRLVGKLTTASKPNRSKLQDLREEALRMLPVGSKSSTKSRPSFEDALVKPADKEPDKQKASRSSSESKRASNNDTEKASKSLPTNGKTKGKNSLQETTADDRRSRKETTKPKHKEKNQAIAKPSVNTQSKSYSTTNKSEKRDEYRPPGTIVGFRIPKIKRPDPPPVPEPEYSEEDELEDPEPDVILLEEDDLESEDAESISEEHPTTEDRTTTPEPEPVNSSTTPPTASKHGLDTDSFLKDFLTQSLPAEKLLKMNPESWTKMMESLKGELSAKLQQFTEDNEEDSPSALALQEEKSESVNDIVVPDVETSDVSSRKCRSVVRKKNSKRRSSLEKLHDALREMNFDSIMPLGPRRTTRAQPDNILEPATVTAVVNQLQIPTSEERTDYDDLPTVPEQQEKPQKEDIPKPKRGRKRKNKIQIVKKIKVLKSNTEIMSTETGEADPDESPLKKGKKQRKYVKKVHNAEREQRMVTRSRIVGGKDVVVNNEDKIESDYVAPLRPELPELSEPEKELDLPVAEAENNIVVLNEMVNFAGIDENFDVKMDSAFFETADFDALERDISATLISEMCREPDSLPKSKLSTSFNEMYNNLMKPLQKTNEAVVRVDLESHEKVQEEVEQAMDWTISTVEFQKEANVGAEFSYTLMPEFLDLTAPEINIDNLISDNIVDVFGEEVFDSFVEDFVPKDNNSLQDSVSPNDGTSAISVHCWKPENGMEADTRTEIKDTGVLGNTSRIEDSATPSREQRIHNLEGQSLYRCANESCRFTASNGIAFKDHAYICGFVTENKQATCFHCDKKLKSICSLMEHLKIHGCQKQICSLCPFRCWLNIELVKHMKLVHKVINYKIIKISEDGESEFIMYPKDVWCKLSQPKAIQENTIMFSPKVQFAPEQIDSVPRNSIFPSLVHCALCKYSTKVRSNLLRHLNLHEQAKLDGGVTQVPNDAPINPVPYLERKELMFDKMTNWAGSSHTNKEKSGVSVEEASKLPQFILEQLRYVCSVSNCKQISGDDSLLRSHMKALHSDVDTYICPHCQCNESSKNDPRNTVTIDKIGHHLKLHGARLLKCGHCDHIHIQTRVMEKHVSEKHPEKKPIHYVIRNLDTDGNSANRRSSVEEVQRNSSDRWRCTLCRALSYSWDEAKSHCESSHGTGSQFMCSSCRFNSSSIFLFGAHLTEGVCSVTRKQASIMIMFSRNESNGQSDTKEESANNQTVWRRNNSKVKHIRGIYLEEIKERKEAKEKEIKEFKDIKPPPVIIMAAPKSSTKGGSQLKIKMVAPLIKPVPQFACPKCSKYKTKNAHDFTIHLHNEFQYRRYNCSVCEIGFVTLESLKIHVVNDHKDQYSDSTYLRLGPVDKEIENFVAASISIQSNDGKLDRPEVVKTPRQLEMIVKCKHCEVVLSSYHNYKTHLIAKHLAPERFKCSYCPVGFWSEGVLKIHHGKAHPDRDFRSILDDELEKSLTPDFWRIEYGIPHTKWTKGGLGRRGEGKNILEKPLSNAFRKIENKIAKPVIRGIQALKKKRRPKYICFHCKKSSSTIHAMRNHWTKAHRNNGSICSYSRIQTTQIPQVWLCTCCSFSTSSISRLQAHFGNEHNGKRFTSIKQNKNQNPNNIRLKCYYCQHVFDRITEIEEHTKLLHPNNVVKYSSTPAAFNTQEKFFQDEVIFECKHCKKRFKVREDCLNHMMTYHSEPMSTVEANMIFAPKEYEMHGSFAQQKLSKGGVFGCPKCELTSTDMNEIKEHITDHVYPFTCSNCNLNFKSPTEATFHFRHDHGNSVQKAGSNKNAVLEFSMLLSSIIHHLPTLSESVDSSCPYSENVGLSDEEDSNSNDDVIIVSPAAKISKKHPTARKSTSGIPFQFKVIQPTGKQLKVRQVALKGTTQIPMNQPAELQNIDLSSIPDFKYDSDDEFPFFLDENLASPSSFGLAPDCLEWTDVFVKNSTGENSTDLVSQAFDQA